MQFLKKKSNFYSTHYMEFQSFVYILLLLTVKTYKMELMIGDNLINDEHSIPIIITPYIIVKSIVKVYHAFKDLWKGFINEQLTSTIEPDNVVDKYAVYVKNMLKGHSRTFTSW